MKNFLYNTINNLFRFVTILSITFVWLNYYLRSFKTSLIVGIFITTIILVVINYFIKIKQNKNNITKNELDKINEITYQFILQDNKENVTFFYNLFVSNYKTEKYAKGIVVTFDDNKILFYPIFKFENITQDDLVNAYKLAKKHNCDKLVILTKSADDLVNIMAKKLDIKVDIFNDAMVYKNILKPHDYYPTITITLTQKKFSIKDILKISFNKSRVKGYFFGGLILLFSSFFTPFNIYYVIMSSLFFGFALFSFFNPYFINPTLSSY